jgi:hypothetical protein
MHIIATLRCSARLALVAAFVVLAACGGPPPTSRAEGPAREAPPASEAPLPLAPPRAAAAGAGARLADSLRCVEAALARSPVITERAPIERGWRLRLRVYSSPPSGWIEKGSIVHDGARIAYIPDGSTRGLAEELVRGTVGPVLQSCR